MKITSAAYPYRVQLSPTMVVAFPASMSLKEVEAACKRLSDEKRPKKTRTAPKVKVSSRSKAVLGANTADAIADRLSRLLDGTNPKTASEEERQEIFQQTIAYRKTSRQLDLEKRSIIDRKVAQFSNGSFKKPDKKK